MKRPERLFINSRFLLFFLSQSFVSCGAFIQVVAVAQLIVGITNSGLLTGFSIVCAPIPGILLSLFAGNLGDKLKSGRLLLIFDLVRGCLVILFTFCRTVPSIFLMMTLSGILDVLYSPSRNKTLTSALEKEQLIRGNSLLNGGYGAVSLIMPALTGFLVGTSGVKAVFFIGGAFYFLSALMLSHLHINQQPADKGRDAFGEILKGLRYCFSSALLKRTVLTLALIDFGTVSVNIAFYSLAFDKLKVTSGHWGLVLSVFYGMNVVAMLFLVRCQKVLVKKTFAFANLFLFVVSLVWCFYAVADNFPAILGAAAVEGFFTSLGTTLLVTTMLKTARTDLTARVSGVRDLCSYTSKLTGIGFTYLLMHFLGVTAVFVSVAGIIMLAVVILTVMPIAGRFRNKLPDTLKGRLSK